MPEERPQFGAFLPASPMYFCSGQPTHFCSGVDRRLANTNATTVIGIMKALYASASASMEGKLADSIVEDILQL